MSKITLQVAAIHGATPRCMSQPSMAAAAKHAPSNTENLGPKGSSAERRQANSCTAHPK